MSKEDFLKRVAESGYNVGFGAKKHFASYDIITKTSGIISFIAIAVGIFALFIPALADNSISAIIILLGVVGVYISGYDDTQKKQYDERGIEFTSLFNSLKDLYFKSKKLENSEFDKQFVNLQKELSDIENEFYSKSISKQVLFSDLFAHYKFFWQMEISWINEVRPFGFLRDKIPLSLTVIFVLLIILLIYLILGDFITISCDLSLKE